MMNRAASTPTAAPAPATATITTSLRRHQNHRIEPQAALSLAVASSHTPMTMTTTAPSCRFESPTATAAAADVFLRVPNQSMQKQLITRTRGSDQFGDPPNSGNTQTKKKLSSTMLHFLKTQDFKNETDAAAKSKSNGPTTTTTRGTTTTIRNHTDTTSGDGRWDPYNLEDSFSSLSSLQSGSLPRITSRTFNRVASTPAFGVHNAAWPSSSSQQQQQQHTNRNKHSTSTSNAKFDRCEHLVLRSGLSHNHTHIIGRRGGMGMMQLSASTPALTLALSSASSSSSSSSALRSLATHHRSNNT